MKELDSLKEQLNMHGPAKDQNKVIDKLERELQGKKTEVASLKDKVCDTFIYRCCHMLINKS